MSQLCAATTGDQMAAPTTMTPVTFRERTSPLDRRADGRPRSWSEGSSYTATVTKKRDGEPDIVRELQEDAKWSSWTNSIERWRGRPRGPVPRDPSIWTFMLAATLVFAIGVAVVGLIALILSLD